MPEQARCPRDVPLREGHVSNAKRRHRRRRRGERAWERQIERWKKQGLWDFSRSRSWYDEDGKLLGHITVGGFGYY